MIRLFRHNNKYPRRHLTDQGEPHRHSYRYKLSGSQCMISAVPSSKQRARTNFQCIKHSPVHCRLPANTRGPSHRGLARGERISCTPLDAGRMARVWRRPTPVRSGNPSGDDEPSGTALGTLTCCPPRGSRVRSRPGWRYGTRYAGGDPIPQLRSG